MKSKQVEVDKFKKEFAELQKSLETHQEELQAKENDFFEHQMSLQNERKLTVQMQSDAQKKDNQIRELQDEIKTLMAQKQAASAQ